MSKGDAKTTQYEVSGSGGGPGNTQSVTTQSMNYKLQISDSTGVVWQRQGSSGDFAPPVVVLTGGQSLQDAVGGETKNAGFFGGIEFPRNVIRQPPTVFQKFTRAKW